MAAEVRKSRDLQEFWGSLFPCFVFGFHFFRRKQMLRKLFRDRKGQGLVEYALLVAGIAVVALAAVSTLGHKTNDMLSTAAVLLPGAHTDDNNPMASGHLIETTAGTGGSIAVDTATIATNSGTDRLGASLFGGSSNAAGNGLGGLITETP
jgi:Flp pilus assembly pilin Flp